MEISDQTTSLDPYFASFEDSLSAKNYKPDTLANYRYLLRRRPHRRTTCSALPNGGLA